MSLTAEELDSILTFTDSCEDAKQSIQELSASLFNDKLNEQRLISGLACLLECELLSKAARVGVIVALAAPKETPFREIYHRINPVLTDPHEQKLLRNILSGKTDVLQKSPQTLLSTELPDVALPQIEKALGEDTRSALQRAAISSIIPDPERFNVSNQSDEQLRRTSMQMILSEPGFGQRFLRPTQISIPPPIFDYIENELEWMLPHEHYNHALEWDDDMCQNSQETSEFERLLKFSTERKLDASEEAYLKEAIKREHRLMESLGFTAELLPQLVEYNPMLTVEFLMTVLEHEDKSEIKKYLHQMTQIPVTLQSLEVVNRLVSQVELPSDFIPYYISRCTKTCEDQKDRSQQGRLVRLVCVFLRALINNSLYDMKDSLSEVQGFCVEFARIREAAALFRLLRKVDSERSARS